MDLPPTYLPGYVDDLLNQPAAVRDTLDFLREQHLPDWIPEGLERQEYRRIVLTGMGASYHALHPLHQGLVGRGMDAQMIETSELVFGLSGLLRHDTLVIAVSQSGESAETVRLVDQKDRPFGLLGVTNTPGSTLAERSDACILTRAGAEYSVSCKTYLSVITALAWLEPVLAGGLADERLSELEAIPQRIEEYLSGWQAHAASLKALLQNKQHLFLAGRGASLASAGCGGLIIKEASHVHAEGMSSAAFRHGPFEMTTAQSFVLVFAGRGQDAALNQQLAEDVIGAGGTAALVSENAQIPALRLPRAAEAARPMLEILPVQMMTIALAELNGRVPGKFDLSKKVTTTL